jgi:hypothetical protein
VPSNPGALYQIIPGSTSPSPQFAGRVDMWQWINKGCPGIFFSAVRICWLQRTEIIGSNSEDGQMSFLAQLPDNHK